MGHKHLGDLGPFLARLTNAQSHLASAICWHVPDHKSELIASAITIGEWSGRKQATVLAQLPSLVEVGILEVVEPARRGRPGVYRLANYASDPRSEGSKDASDPRSQGSKDASDPRSQGSTTRIHPSNYASDSRQGSKQVVKELLRAAIDVATAKGADFPESYAKGMIKNGWRPEHAVEAPPLPSPEECPHPAPWAQLDDMHRCRLCSAEWPTGSRPPVPREAS